MNLLTRKNGDKYIDITQDLLDKYPPRPNKVGRYSCTKIYAILQGWTTPEQYLDGEEVDLKGARNMLKGTYKHEAIQSILADEYFMEYKKVMKVYDFEIVGMADMIKWLLDPEERALLELKTSDNVHPKAKPWAVHQIKLYLTLFEMPRGILVQPVETPNKQLLKVLGEYKRNDVWFWKQMDKLAEFHKQVYELQNMRNRVHEVKK